MLKFQRSYTLTIETNIKGAYIVIKDPITLEFSIVRKFGTIVNNATLRIYNLGLQTRNSLYRDPYSMYDINKLRTIELKAGYGANQATIFYGNVLQATSTRVSGSTEFMTEIVGFDGGGAIANAFSSKSYGPGVSRDGVISDIANDLLNIGDVSLGRIDPLFGSNNYQRGRPLSDKSWKLLQLETGNRAFIDNGRLYVLADSNYSNADILVVNSASGLLGTPVRGETMVSVNILFEPNVQIGQGVQLISESEPVYNGIWRCQGLSHRGVISGAVCGEVVTKLDLLTSNTSFETIAQQTGLGALVLS